MAFESLEYSLLNGTFNLFYLSLLYFPGVRRKVVTDKRMCFVPGLGLKFKKTEQYFAQAKISTRKSKFEPSVLWALHCSYLFK